MDTSKESDKELEKLAEFHASNFTRFTEIEGLIIRGHILFEQGLNRAIELSIINKSAYKPDRFTFSHKVQIARMLGMLKHFEKEVNALNKLRNQIAHSLLYEEKWVDLIIQEVSKKHPVIKDCKDNKVKALGTSISFMCGALSFDHKEVKLNYYIKVMDSIIEGKMKTSSNPKK